MTDPVFFKSFYEMDEAESLRDFLLSKGIDCRVEKKRAIMDSVYAGHSGDKNIFLVMEPKDFAKANELIDEEIRARISEIGPDYYLYSFTDTELMEVISKPDEWNNQDVLIAQQLLAQHDKVITDQQITQTRENRKKVLAKPQETGMAFLVASYLLTVILPIYGVFVALFLMNTRTLLPDGTRVPAYTAYSRMHAKIILVLGLIGVVMFLLRIAGGFDLYMPFVLF
ncbi:MAG: hypothetical protein EOO05_03265 [Chitinophagaceae bacterium]|nr:MAG: hypothetical protein EOO05_03265 [Chitinophagaceae bacterium]